jgi:subtilase family serine protease
MSKLTAKIKRTGNQFGIKSIFSQRGVVLFHGVVVVEILIVFTFDRRYVPKFCVGRVMRIHKTGLCRGVLAGASLLAFSCLQAGAQTAAQSGAAQKNRVAARVTDQVDDTNRTVLRGNVHPKARAEFDQGAVADAQPLTRILLLLQRSADQEAALRQLMEQQQAKNSPNYHAWLTPEQFGTQFGPADADVQAVTDWLTSHGFQNIKVAKGKTIVEFSGNVGQVRNAFQTEIHKYNVKGAEHFANASDPQIPAALAPVVRGVVALHNFRPKSFLHNAGTFQRNAKTGEVKPAFTFSDVNGTFYAVGPADFAKIYNVPTATWTGANQSIAIVGQSNITLQDVADFRSIFGLPANVPQVILNGPDPGLVPGDETESDLDVEWAGAVAPQAHIIFVTSQTTDTDFVAGVDASAQYIVDNNVAPILSESYGSCEAGLGTTGNAFYNSLWQQAAAEGITVVIAAGDNGSAGCDPALPPANQNAATQGLGVSGFASTPFNVALGGTDFDDANNQGAFWNPAITSTTPPVPASALGYIPETTWNDSCAATATAGNVSGHCTTVSSTGSDLVAGSGGSSSVYTGSLKPSWQTTFGDANRDIPDVSLFSSDGFNKTFYIVCESDQDITGDTGCSLTKFTSTPPFHDFQAVGGTSAATPTFAGIVALINQKTGQRQGNVNYVLYSLAKNENFANCNSSSFTNPTVPPPATCVFQDITKGNASVACVGGSSNCSNTSTAANQFGIMATTTGGTTPAFGTSTGYDLATGLGSVNVANLLNAWASPSRTASTTTLNLSNASPTLGTNVTVSGLVGPGTATGLVLLENSVTGVVIPANPTASNAVTAGGNYSFTTAFLPAGSYSVIAHYGGDGTFAGSNSSPAVPVTIGKQNSQVVVSFVTFTGPNGTTPVLNTSAQSLPYGSAYILRVDVENANGAPTPCENFQTAVVSFVCPTGTVQLLSNGSPLNDFPSAQNPNSTNIAKLNDRGFAEDQPIQLAPGAYSITATYSPDANSSYNAPASASNALSVTITKAATTAAVTSNVASVAAGGSVTLTALISTTSNGAGPTGTVQFKNGSSNLGTASATCTPAAANTSAASCTATLTTALSEFIPPAKPWTRPQVPTLPLGIVSMLLIVFLAMQRRLSMGKRIGYAAAGLLLFACVAAGIAGCSGTSSGSNNGGGGSGPHTDSITAVYGGDANYTGSTSAATTVTVQ